MSLYVVERENPDYYWRTGLEALVSGWYGTRPAFVPYTVPVVVDCNARDGEWPAVITLAHETVEFDGRAVPVFEGDVERREWEAGRRRARSGLASSPAPGAGGQRGR